MEEFQLGLVNEEVHTLAMRVLEGLESDFDGWDFSEERDAIRKALEEREKVQLVFVGQYSAGKSSIIKMLTGDANIEIAAEIKTDEAKTYAWGGVEITDTPGIDTQLHPEHDEKTKQAIQESDMLVFVITNELMDATVAQRFQELAKEKPGALILVVNKMSRAVLGNTPEQQQIIRDDLCKVTDPKTPEDYCLSFLDARDYLDAQEENDEELRDELEQRSGQESFVRGLNHFIEERQLLGKLVRPLYVCKEQLARVEDRLLAAASGDLEALEEQKGSLDDVKKDVRQTIDTCADMLKQGFQNAGEQVVQKIALGAAKADLERAQKAEAEQREALCKEVFETWQQSLYHIAETHDMTMMELFQEEDAENGIHGIAQKIGHHSDIQLSAQPYASGTSEGTQRIKKAAIELGKNMGSVSERTVANALGYSNAFTRFLHGGKIAQATTATRAAGPAMAGILEVGSAIYENHQREKAEKAVKQAREEYRQAVEKDAEQARKAFQDIGKAVQARVAESIDRLKQQRKEMQAEQNRHEDALQQIRRYQEEVQKAFQLAGDE